MDVKTLFSKCSTHELTKSVCVKKDSSFRWNVHSKWNLLNQILRISGLIKGCGMGPWLVLVSPCFRENVVATCKIESFLCSLDNLLQKNETVFFFGNQISKWRSFEKKGGFFTYFSHFLVTRESYKNSFSTYLTYIPTHILLTLLTFLPCQFWKRMRIYQVWFHFGMIPGVDSYSRFFGTINK